MILMKLLLLAVIASLCYAEELPESYLVYAVENRGSVFFHLTDLDFNNTKTIFKLDSVTLDNLYLSRDKGGLVVYWSYKSSSRVGRYEVSTNNIKIKALNNENTVFLGLGYDNNIYLYSPTSKHISVHGHDLEKKIMELGGLENSNTDMHCVDIDPRNREQILFAECTGSNISKVYDISVKSTLSNYEVELPECFDTWRITPNGQKAYAVSGNKIFRAPYGGAPFAEMYTADEKIVGFAVGNNDLYYSNKEKEQESKIFKLTPSRNGFNTRNVKVEGAVKLLAVYTPPKRYLIYATLNGDKIDFYKTDLDFGQSTHLFTTDIYGDGFDKMYLAYHNDDNNDGALYLSYKNSPHVKRYGLSTNSLIGQNLEEYFGTLVGIGNDNDLYFYSPVTNKFTVYNFLTKEKKSLTFPNMHCVNVDPGNREVIWFSECKDTNNKVSILYVSFMVALEEENKNLPVCFDIWGITPNGKNTYAVKDKTIYLSPKNGDTFKVFSSVEKDIEHFAIGNNELFYTAKDAGKIFKISPTQNSDSYLTVDHEVKGQVKALALHQE